MATTTSSPPARDGRARIVFVNRSYWPDQEATGQLLTDLCTFLGERWDVHVICGQPNSVDSVDAYVRHGISDHQGVTIHRLKHASFPKKWPSGRLVNLLSFTSAARRYLRRTRFDAELYICETDPFLLPIVLSSHARRTSSRFVAYLQDIYPDVAVAIEKVREGFLTRQIRARLKNSYQRAECVVVLGEDMRERLAGWGIDREDLRIIPNWVDCDQIQPLKSNNPFRHRHGLADKFVVMHSGNMGLTQRLEDVVAATRSKHWPEDGVLALVGDGAARESLKALASEAPVGRVLFFPYQARSELSTSLSAADLHLISMDRRITGCLFPSKFYGILASGTPALMIAPASSEPAQLVEKNRIGWSIEPGNPDSIAKTVALARYSPDLQAMGHCARELAVRSYDRNVACQMFADMLRELLDQADRRGEECGTFSAIEPVRGSQSV